MFVSVCVYVIGGEFYQMLFLQRLRYYMVLLYSVNINYIH